MRDTKKQRKLKQRGYGKLWCSCAYMVALGDQRDEIRSDNIKAITFGRGVNAVMKYVDRDLSYAVSLENSHSETV